MNFQHVEEIKAGSRFAFGSNWARFLGALDETRVQMAVESLGDMLAVESLQGKCFLDIGCGSGLFSLAARKLGATVHSFDYDAQSVKCARRLKEQFYPNDGQWTIEQGSALDAKYMAALGQYDIVYSWGVLHHTGQMHQAFSLAAPAVVREGKLFIAIYNDQGFISKYWNWVKRLYNKNALGRVLMITLHAPYLLALRWLVRTLRRRPLERGMSLRYDMLDWLGGYPFEVASPEHVFDFFRDRGFILQRLKTCRGRNGCNEFVMQRQN